MPKKIVKRFIFTVLLPGIGLLFMTAGTRSLMDILIEKRENFAYWLDEIIIYGKSPKTNPIPVKDTTSLQFQSFNNEKSFGTNMVDTDTVNDAIEFPVPQKLSCKTRFDELDQYAGEVPVPYTLKIQSLVDYLIRPAVDDLEKTRVIYRWIALNIKYDDEAFNSDHVEFPTPEQVLQKRTAICSDYTKLFRKMGEEAGLEIIEISGWSKGIGYQPGCTYYSPNHIWNAVKIDGQWRLFDVTWGHGYAMSEGGRMKSIPAFNDFWFDTDPYAFIFTHLPMNSGHQFIETPISKTEFEALSYAGSTFFMLGFDPRTCFNRALLKDISGFPDEYDVDGHVQAVSLPMNGVIKAGTKVRFILKSNEAFDIAVKNNNLWIDFHKRDDLFTLVFQPQRGELIVSAKFEKGSSSYQRLLSYQVR
jgi:hypothetical protein